MDGIHDMGGMDGFGAIEREDDEPVFHADWERRAFALSFANSRFFGPIDQRRHLIELLPPAEYLRSTYYEKWLLRLVAGLGAAGALTEEEIASGECAAAFHVDPPPSPDEIAAVVRAGTPYVRETGRQEAKFAVGDRVRTLNLHPPGHTRLPRYARGRVGTIAMLHGTHVFPDANAHGNGENPQPLYSVGFAARELWGREAAADDHVHIDLWEDYLEPLEEAAE